MNDGPSEEATATEEVAVLQNSLTDKAPRVPEPQPKHHSIAAGWEPSLRSRRTPKRRNPLIDAELHLDAARELAHRASLEIDADLDLAWDYERRALLHTITALRACLDAIDHGLPE